MKKRIRQPGEVFTYAERNQLLKELGYDDYADYLSSSTWKMIRYKAYALHGRKCKLCSSESSALHHVRYHKQILLGRDVTFVVPICRKCHTEIEFKSNGKKRGLASVYKCYKKKLDWLESERKKKKKPQTDQKVLCPICKNHLKKNGNPCVVCARTKVQDSVVIPFQDASVRLFL